MMAGRTSAATERGLRLRVAEGVAKDLGRAVARIDPEDMEVLGVRTGDLIEVEGARLTAARVVPTQPAARGASKIQIDGIIRDNAGVGLGDEVHLRPVRGRQAEKLVLAPLGRSATRPRGEDESQLRSALQGLPLVQGDRVRVAVWGTRHRELSVMETAPDGVVLAGSQTRISVRGSKAVPRKKGAVTYEDVGAVRDELAKIREIVELPLRHPELFDQLGIDAPKGVLLHGPPGCGKTLIARAIASESNAAFFKVSGPEVVHRYYGESEAHLRSVFDKAAQSSPAIVFIDEIDAIAAKRGDVRGDQQVERRLVAQLLALMDGLEPRRQVVVIAATNMPDLLDPALRRPGRFDREIEIGVPDRHGRLEILQIHTAGMPLADDVDLDQLAAITHGFVGADLESLCREAAMAALRDVSDRISLEAEVIPLDVLSGLEVSVQHFQQALRDVGPSAIREVFAEVPSVRWDDVGGLAEVKRALREAVEWPIKHAEVFESVGMAPPKGILLVGPPGTGKTLLAKAVATETEANFISVKASTLVSKWAGESEKAIAELFRKARQAAPCLLFVDEIDTLAPARTGGESHYADRVVGQFLTELDGINALQGVTVIAATNRQDVMDPALKRAGRFDLILELPYPDSGGRQEILSIHTRNRPLAQNVSLEALVSQTDGMTGADIEHLCNRAAMSAVRDFLERPDGSEPTEHARITAVHFEAALREAAGQVR